MLKNTLNTNTQLYFNNVQMYDFVGAWSPYLHVLFEEFYPFLLWLTPSNGWGLQVFAFTYCFKGALPCVNPCHGGRGLVA
jgi:hypothetical protein